MKRKAAVDYFETDSDSETDKNKRDGQSKKVQETVEFKEKEENKAFLAKEECCEAVSPFKSDKKNDISSKEDDQGKNENERITDVSTRKQPSDIKPEFSGDSDKETVIQLKQNAPNTSMACTVPEQVIDPVALQQYQMYQQQYQQYYAQYYANYYPNQNQSSSSATASASASTNDPIYDYYTATPSVSTSASFESSRASRQMSAYFDPNKFHAVLSPDMQAAQQHEKQKQQAKLTVKDIEAFKKRKAELKKKKNQWLYE